MTSRTLKTLSRLHQTFFEEDSRAANAELDDLNPLKQEGCQREDSRAANAELDDPKGSEGRQN
jgi:hypothetical protein